MVSGRLAEFRRRGVAGNEARLEKHVEAVSAAFIEPLDNGLHRFLGLLAGLLTDSGQIDVSEPGQHAVVVSGDRDTAGNLDAGTAELVEESDRAAVVGRTYCRGAFPPLQELQGG